LRRLEQIVRKLRRVAVSDLVPGDKLRYVLKAARHLAAPVAAPGAGLFTYRLRGSRLGGNTSIALRKGTTDSKVFDEILVERAYAPCLDALPHHIGQITLIDLGANIGLSALFFARALRVSEVIAVEPDPENFQLLLENLQRAGLANRSTAVRAFAGAERAFAQLHDSGNGAWGMRMGRLSDIGTPVLPVAEIADMAKPGVPLVLKCDIEGAERQLFLNIRDWEHLISYIFLELHTEFLPVREMFACLESSGFQWKIHGTPLAGASIALVVLERGERRNRLRA
jgi:FkbM family methyltransferase